LRICPFNNSIIFLNGYDNLYVSTNSGSQFNTNGVKWLRAITFSYADSMIYGCNTNKFYFSSNFGINWDSVTTNYEFISLESNPDNKNILYAGCADGLYRTTNKGINWQLYNNSFTASKKVIGISKDPGTGDTLFVATNKSLFKVWASFLVGVSNGSTNVVNKFGLSQNYPNPFNPSTNIKYDIMNKSFVTIKVYNIIGKEIVTLVNKEQNTGTYEVQFSNNLLPGGIYFYKLEAVGPTGKTINYTETRKMILLK